MPLAMDLMDWPGWRMWNPGRWDPALIRIPPTRAQRRAPAREQRNCVPVSSSVPPQIFLDLGVEILRVVRDQHGVSLYPALREETVITTRVGLRVRRYDKLQSRRVDSHNGAGRSHIADAIDVVTEGEAVVSCYQVMPTGNPIARIVGILERERRTADFLEVVASDDYRDRRVRLKGNTIQSFDGDMHRVRAALIAEYPGCGCETSLTGRSGGGANRASALRDRKAHADVRHRVAVLIEDLYRRSGHRIEPGPSHLRNRTDRND